MNESSGSGLWPIRIVCMRSPLVATRVGTRGRILEAALEVFARKGYHGASDIVRASGTSKGAVYHHFPNKEAVFLALVDDFATRLAAAVGAAVGARQGALGKVEGALMAALATFAENERLARLILLEAVSLGPLYQRKRAEGAGPFPTLIQGHPDQAAAARPHRPAPPPRAPPRRPGAVHQGATPRAP